MTTDVIRAYRRVERLSAGSGIATRPAGRSMVGFTTVSAAYKYPFIIDRGVAPVF